MEDKKELWGIVLAAGEGSRARGFLSALCGGRGIKQFCSVLGERSLLQMTLDRVQSLIPRERIVVIVDKRHRPEVVEQLSGWPQQNIIYQPVNRETAPGILLPLAYVSHRSPNATVAVFPSDHFIEDERSFINHVAKAVGETELLPDSAVLLGTKPDRIEEGYGWISSIEDRQGRGSRAVQGFWEKPSPAQAQELMRQGALWNTFVFAARAATLWEMTRRTVPDLYGAFSSMRVMLETPRAHQFIEEMYTRLRTVNFSVEVLTPSVSRLRVLPIPEIGWSDWGSAERILETAMRMGRLHELAARLRERPVNDASVASLVSRYQSNLLLTYQESAAMA